MSAETLFLLFVIGFIFYVLLGCVIYAAVKCRWANHDGYVAIRYEEAALHWAMFWPFLLIGLSVLRLIPCLSSYFFRLCFRKKWGKEPTYY